MSDQPVPEPTGNPAEPDRHGQADTLDAGYDQARSASHRTAGTTRPRSTGMVSSRRAALVRQHAVRPGRRSAAGGQRAVRAAVLRADRPAAGLVGGPPLRGPAPGSLLGPAVLDTATGRRRQAALAPDLVGSPAAAAVTAVAAGGIAVAVDRPGSSSQQTALGTSNSQVPFGPGRHRAGIAHLAQRRFRIAVRRHRTRTRNRLRRLQRVERFDQRADHRPGQHRTAGRRRTSPPR